MKLAIGKFQLLSLPNNSTALKITMTMVAAIILLSIIFLIASPLPNQQNNGFERKWLKNALQPLQSKQTEIPIESVCGATDQSIFITTKNPRCLLRINNRLEKFDSIFFPVNPTPEVMSNRHFIVDSPWTYLFINNEPGLILGSLKDSIVRDPLFTATKQLFIQSSNISPSTAVIRTLDSLQSKQVFQKINCFTGQVLAEEPIFKEQTDLGLSTGGILEFDRAKKLLTYVQFYQNRFYVLDTNLNILSQSNTIDTTFTNDMQVKQANIDGVDKIVPSKARISVNKHAYPSNGLLYILSGLRADNESITAFNSNSVIDIYNLETGAYIGSFYIPNINGHKLTSFLVRKGNLIALYKTDIVTFRISLSV